jgi:hypothetical protein
MGEVFEVGEAVSFGLKPCREFPAFMHGHSFSVIFCDLIASLFVGRGDCSSFKDAKTEKIMSIINHNVSM